MSGAHIPSDQAVYNDFVIIEISTQVCKMVIIFAKILSNEKSLQINRYYFILSSILVNGNTMLIFKYRIIPYNLTFNKV